MRDAGYTVSGDIGLRSGGMVSFPSGAEESAEPKTVLAESDQRTAAGCLLNKTRESQRKLRVIGWAFARVYS